MTTKPIIVVCLTAVAACGCGGVRPDPQRRDSPDRDSPTGRLTPEARAALTARTEAVFQRGVFYKPAEGVMPGRPFDLAPLIVQEVRSDAIDARRNRFGALAIDEGGSAAVDADRPTIYTGGSTAILSGRVCEQATYLWCYGPGRRSRLDGSGPSWRGVRMTLDAEGFPIIWEVLPAGADAAMPADATVLYVSRALEEAAAVAYGPPLPGRRYSIERSVGERPNVVVARVLDDGPEPMGPFVYLDAGAGAVTTLLCRCMPSQVASFVEDVYYELRPLADLAAVDRLPPGGRSVLPALPAAVIPGEARSAPSLRLERALRLPPWSADASLDGDASPAGDR